MMVAPLRKLSMPFCSVGIRSKRVGTTFRLSERDLLSLMMQAPRYHGCPATLIRDLIVTIARENMVAAVLDDERPA